MLALSGPETLTYYWRMLHQLAGFRTIDTSTESDSEPDNTLPPVGKKFNHLKKKSYLLSFCKIQAFGAIMYFLFIFYSSAVIYCHCNETSQFISQNYPTARIGTCFWRIWSWASIICKQD